MNRLATDGGRAVWIGLVVCAVCLVVVVFLLRGEETESGLPKPDPDAIAAAETRMWQAYYKHDPMALGIELIDLMQVQFGLSLFEATDVSEALAQAAVKFLRAKGNYGPTVLPDLERAYNRIKELSGGSFDPREAARAELDWWVARRTPGIDTPEEVGKRIARLYVVLYGEPRPEFERAGYLRAQAAHLRDLRGAEADWIEIERLLQESYRELVQGL